MRGRGHLAVGDAQHLAGGTRRPHQGLAFVEPARQGVLEEHVLARLQRGAGDPAVAVVVGADRHRVNVGALQKLFPASQELQAVAAGELRPGARVAGGQGDGPAVLQGCKGGGTVRRHASGTHQTQANSFHRLIPSCNSMREFLCIFKPDAATSLSSAKRRSR